jgi:hypothetical protein
MNKIALAVVILAAVSTASHAGNLTPPVIEVAPEVIVQEATKSSGDGWVFLMMLAAVIAAAAS